MQGDGTDVAILGAGFAGSLAAVMIGAAGYDVTLIDVNPDSHSGFRAEKIDSDQLALLNEMGLLDVFKAAGTLANKVINIRGKAVIDRRHIEEYGLHYSEMISLLRSRFSSNLQMRQGRVIDIAAGGSGGNRQAVILEDGTSIEARLVVLACGHNEPLFRQLSFKKISISRQPTIAVGFSMRPPATGFSFPSLAAYGERQGDGIDYVSLFPIEDLMRANLFLFTSADDPRLHRLRSEGPAGLFDFLPGLEPWLRHSQWMNDVVIRSVDVCKYENLLRDGVVVIGDAFRTSCPSVGTGLTCAITDVLCLRGHIDSWMTDLRVSADQIQKFYDSPQKLACDARAHELALKRRKIVTTVSYGHRLKRSAYFMARRLRGQLRDTLNRDKNGKLSPAEPSVLENNES